MKTKILLAIVVAVLCMNRSLAAETEPNNSKAQSNTLALNGSNSGKLTANDEDWWKVTTNKDGKLSVSLTSTNGIYIWIHLYDNNGTTLISETYSTSTANIQPDGLAAGTYYIRVNAYYTTNTGSYSISNNLVTPAQAIDPEPNDTKTQALTLPQNSSATGHVGYYYQNKRDTADWYKISLSQDGLLRLKLNPVNGSYVWMYLYDNNGTTLINSTYSASPYVMNTDGLAAGTYYVRVNCYYNSNFAPYVITDSLYTPTQVNDAEPNDTRQQAVAFAQNSTKKGHVGYYYNNKRDSADWYKIVTAEDGYLQFSLTPANGEYVWMYLYDKDGTTLINSAYSTTTYSLTTDGLAAGTYYLRVNCYYNSRFAPYTVSNTLTTYNFTNDKEPNDYAKPAQTIAANSTVKGHVGFYNDHYRDPQDWWKVNYTGTGNLNFTFNLEKRQKVGSITYTWFYVYKDTAANPIYSSYFTAPSTAINLTSLSKGYYYIKVLTYYSSNFSEFQAYSINAAYTQTGCSNSLKITKIAATPGSDCSNGKVVIQAGSGSAPYSFDLYRDGAYVDTKTTTTGKYTFTGLPAGTYYVNGFQDGASGTCYVSSVSKAMAPAPSNLSTTAITAATATLNWLKLDCATNYQVQYRVVNTTKWIKKKTVGNVAKLDIAGLKANTNYEWQVITFSVANGFTSKSKLSVIATFKTAPGAKSTSADNLLITATTPKIAPTLQLYPNPATSYFNLNTTGLKGSVVSIIITDINGKTVMVKNTNNSKAFRTPLNISNLSNGSYIVTLLTEKKEVVSQPLIILK